MPVITRAYLVLKVILKLVFSSDTHYYYATMSFCKTYFDFTLWNPQIQFINWSKLQKDSPLQKILFYLDLSKSLYFSFIAMKR